MAYGAPGPSVPQEANAWDCALAPRLYLARAGCRMLKASATSASGQPERRDRWPTVMSSGSCAEGTACAVSSRRLPQVERASLVAGTGWQARASTHPVRRSHLPLPCRAGTLGRRWTAAMPSMPAVRSTRMCHFSCAQLAGLGLWGGDGQHQSCVAATSGGTYHGGTCVIERPHSFAGLGLWGGDGQHQGLPAPLDGPPVLAQVSASASLV